MPASRIPMSAWMVVSFLFLAVPLQHLQGSEPTFRRGDANADGKRDISDGVRTLTYLFSGEDAPPCMDAADSNDSGVLDISDAVHTLGFLFLGNSPPADPFPYCGSDPTANDGLGCDAYATCAEAPVLVSIQVDAEQEDSDGLTRIVTELRARNIPATVYVSADYANRFALLVSDLYNQGFEIALHGFHTGEQLATMTYAEQKDLLTRAKQAVEGCKPCGIYKPVVGFRPQYFSQNEDTFRVLDELGLTHNSGFKLQQLFLPGHEMDAEPYLAAGHQFSAVPLTTVMRGEERIYICDIACANVLKLTADEWRATLLEGLRQSLEWREPLVILIHGWYTGDTAAYTYWQPFLDFLDAAEGQVTYVTTEQLVQACAE